jgi:hypothetical protein
MSISARKWSGNRGGLLLLVALGLGCSQMHQVQVQDVARAHYLKGDYDGAVKVLQGGKDQHVYEPRDRVAYWMNLGMLLHHAKQYAESNHLLEMAARRADELYTTSISSEAATVLVNETVADYQGENFERVLIHVIGALNYVAAGDLENARVEAVKTNEKLKGFRTQGGEKPPVFSEDAFAEWLTGIIYEMQGDYNDALISFKSSATAYRDVYGKNFHMAAPAFLGEDIVRAAQESGSGFEDDIQRAKQLFPGADGKSLALMRDHGEVLLLHACGEAPKKTDKFINCEAGEKGKLRCDERPGEGGMEKLDVLLSQKSVHKIALPVFEPRLHQIARVRMSEEGQTAESVTVEPVTEIAVKDLADRVGRTFTKTMARAAAKLLTEKGASALGTGIAGILVNKVNAYNEEADKRSWNTLPSEFNVARLWLTPGEHDLALDFLDSAGNVVRHGSIHTTVVAGKRAILTIPTVE